MTYMPCCTSSVVLSHRLPEFDGLGFAGAGRYRILRVQASAFSRDAGVGFCVFVLVERGVAAWVLVLERLLRPLWNQTTAGRSPLPERVR